MDRYYARVREFASYFRPARVFQYAFAETSYYAYLKQRMKTLFQISSLWATPHTLYTAAYKELFTHKKEKKNIAHKVKKK